MKPQRSERSRIVSYAIMFMAMLTTLTVLSSPNPGVALLIWGGVWLLAYYVNRHASEWHIVVAYFRELHAIGRALDQNQGQSETAPVGSGSSINGRSTISAAENQAFDELMKRNWGKN